MAALAAEWTPPGFSQSGEAAAGPADGCETAAATPVRARVSRPAAVVLIVVSLVILGVLAWRLRPPPPSVTEAPVLAVSASPAPAALLGSAAASPTASLVVHVAGKVRHPGLVELPAGARVADAITAAGGLRKGFSLGVTNLAAPVADGQRIDVGSSAAGSAAAAGTQLQAGLVDLNTATADQLDTLPGIGPITAAKIIAWRNAHQRFNAVEELLEVPGIGPKTLAELRPLVRL